LLAIFHFVAHSQVLHYIARLKKERVWMQRREFVAVRGGMIATWRLAVHGQKSLARIRWQA
jgi:hypothetical protein